MSMFIRLDSWRPISITLWVILVAACTGETSEDSAVADRLGGDLIVPGNLRSGEDLFGRHCARCHGERALGSAQGPPLVHRIYQPSHHGDAAFQLAVARGVRAHHWRFGDMSPVDGVSREEVAAVVRYVRWLQQRAGIL